MYQILTVIVAIALLAIVSVGGGGGIDPDVAVRRSVEAQATTGTAAIAQAFMNYRRANGGIYPVLDGQGRQGQWSKDLAPYLPTGELPAVSGLRWTYLNADGRRRICLSSGGAPYLDVVRQGVMLSARKGGGLTMVRDCTSDRSEIVDSGEAAVAFVLDL